MIRRPPRSTLSSSSAASDVYKRQVLPQYFMWVNKVNMCDDQKLLTKMPHKLSQRHSRRVPHDMWRWLHPVTRRHREAVSRRHPQPVTMRHPEPVTMRHPEPVTRLGWIWHGPRLRWTWLG